MQLTKAEALAIAAYIARNGTITYCAISGRKTTTRRPSAAQRRAIVTRYLRQAESAPDAIHSVKPVTDTFTRFLRALRADYHYAAKLCGDS